MSVVSVRSVFLVGGSLLLLGGCSGSEESDAPRGPALSVFEPGSGRGAEAAPVDDEGQAPFVESIRFEPVEPASRERFKAIPRISGDWTSLEYEWSVNGRRFGANAAQVVLPRISTGDEITLRITPLQGTLRGPTFEARTEARNQAPRLRNLSIERAGSEESVAGGGELWRAVVVAEDPDEDDLEIEYRWLVNGRDAGVEGELFPAGELKRGDRLAVRVRAYDGGAWSPFTQSGEITIGNSPPNIVSMPPRLDESGRFRYQLRAEDADGDQRFRFELKTAPRGMQIDEINGIVTWQPAPDQAGRHDVEVVVRDEGGGEATQAFSLALVSISESSSGDPGPAAMR
jgi:hypothetical protein